MTERNRILFIAEAVTLAHVARLVALAESLDSHRYEVSIASDPRYNSLLGQLSFPLKSIHTIPAKQFFSALAQGKAIYGESDLAAYVEEDLGVIDEFRPDVVVGDFRLSLAVSARLRAVPYISISNGYWSPYARLQFPLPDITITRLLGVRLGQLLFDIGRPIAFSLHSRPMNRVRRNHGLAPLASDIREIYTEADYTLYADIAELVPTEDLPENHQFIGPIAWSPVSPLPEWWGSIPDDRPIIYVTLGSSGQGNLLPTILEALEELPVSVIAATAARAPSARIPENAWVTDFLPGDQAAAIASLVVCNGGSPTSYQGLVAGKPIIGIASNLDQYLNMSLVQAAGAGKLIRGGKTSASLVRNTVSEALDDSKMQATAKSLSLAIGHYDALAAFEALVRRIVAARHE